MILGIGLDLVSLPDFSPLLSEDSGFTHGTFSDTELKQSSHTPEEQRLAGFFAAKEAFIKAWSGSRPHQEPAMEEISLKEIEVLHDRYGRPEIRLIGAVESHFVASMGCTSIQVSLSHEPSVAGAVVILTRSR